MLLRQKELSSIFVETKKIYIVLLRGICNKVLFYGDLVVNFNQLMRWISRDTLF